MSQAASIEEFHVDPKDLKDLKRDLLATVFNETHSRLLLLQHGLRRRAAKINKVQKLSINSDLIKTKETPMLSEEVLNDIKLHREIDALRNIYKLVVETLATDKFNPENPYVKILNAIEKQNLASNEAEILANELRENKSILKNLKTQQTREETELAEKLLQKKQRVQELRDQLKDIKCISRLELKLVDKWEANRLAQATIASEKEERLLMQQILDANRRIAGEQRIINEIEAFRNNEISELKQQILQWQERFKTENARTTAQNAALSKSIADVVKTHEKYREIMEQRETFVSDYLKQKAEEQRLYEEQCYRIKCAVRIQAWWRGVMVRRGLGPYRQKSKKGKKSKVKK